MFDSSNINKTKQFQPELGGHDIFVQMMLSVTCIMHFPVSYLIITTFYPIYVSESTSTPRPSTLPPDELGDLSRTHTPEGLPKVASTAFFLILLFVFSLGISYFFRYYVFSRDRKECCCEKQSQVTVSPEAMVLKENTSRQNTPENGNVAKTGRLYANIFARSYDSDEEEIRQLELEAKKAEESGDIEFRIGKKPAVATKTSILKALEMANHLPKLTVQAMTLADKANNGKAVKTVAGIWKDKALNKPDDNKNNIPDMTVVDIGDSSNRTTHLDNGNNFGLTSVVVHRDPSPLPNSTSLAVNDDETNGNLSPERQENDSISETPRTDTTSIGFLSVRPKSSHGDDDGYSADFESVSLYSELSNITELQDSMDSRSARANTARRKHPTPQNVVSPSTKDNTVNEQILSKETSGDHAGNHIVNETSNTGNRQTGLQEPCQGVVSKDSNMRPGSQPQTDASNGKWANKVSRNNPSAPEDGHVKKRVIDSKQSDAHPTLTAKAGDPSQAAGVSNPLEENVAKAASEDDKPGTPESGTPLLLTDEGDAGLKQKASEEPLDLGDASQSRGGNQTPNIYSKYANNAKLPNKHIKGNAEEGDRPSTSAKPKTTVKATREAGQKTHGSSPSKDATNKTKKSSAVSKPSDGTPRSKTGSRNPSAQKKRNAKR